ncbi:MAG TPA: hypothetical protein VK585_10470 [Jiangellaceae bacterium]|nr:hypothetical protein [Jiangellaceae bacterium]
MLARRLAAGAVTLLGLVGCAASGTTPAAVPESPTAVAEESPTVGASPTLACDEPCYGEAETVGMLSRDVVVEASGVAASHRTSGAYYVISDEPGTDEVVAVREDGRLVVRIGVSGMSAENAEALAVGPCGPSGSGQCIFVGDIGDHVGRADVVVYRFPEPDLTAVMENAVAADAVRYTYPDAPTDAEALIVDDSGRPLIVSKAAFDEASATTGPTRLYRGDPDGGVLDPLGEVDLPDPDRPVFTGIAGNVVTDASSTDGRVLLRTYDQVLEYRAPDAGADLGGFPGWPLREVSAPSQIQSEAVGYRPDACGYVTISEFTGSIAAVGCRPS